jgi:hypothetical protein
MSRSRQSHDEDDIADPPYYSGLEDMMGATPRSAINLQVEEQMAVVPKMKTWWIEMVILKFFGGYCWGCTK